MEKIEFTQQINKKDLVDYNAYIAKTTARSSISVYLMGIILIGLSIYTIIRNGTQSLIPSILMIILGLCSTVFYPFILKLGIRFKLRNKNDEMEPIKVSITDRGVLFCFIGDEDRTEVISWKQFYKIGETKNQLLLFVIKEFKVILIKKESVPNVDELKTVFKEKIDLNVNKKKK